ncbi:MAG: arginase, partial [Pygmaiobacter sp.]
GGPADLCGLSSYELAEMLHACGLSGAKGFDFMEVYPPDDLHSVSSHGACWMAIYMIGGMAERLLEEKK